MTELEKCLAGEYYDCHDEVFLKMKAKARRLLKEYHALAYEQKEEKRELLSQLFRRIGTNVSVGQPFLCDYGCNISLGNNVSINMNCTFLDDNRITIGDNALIAPNVQIYTAFHPTNAQERFGTPQADGSFAFCRTRTAPVTIGNNVWIGGGAILLPGVTIGDNVVIGAGSVVTHDIPANKVAFGNPCRVVRDNC